MCTVYSSPINRHPLGMKAWYLYENSCHVKERKRNNQHGPVDLKTKVKGLLPFCIQQKKILPLLLSFR